MIRTILFSVILIGGMLGTIHGIVPKIEDINFITQSGECVQLHRKKLSHSTLYVSYVNRCPWPVNANICTVFSKEKPELKSISKIPSDSGWAVNIFFRFGNVPQTVYLNSSPGIPAVASPCKESNQVLA